MTELNKNKFTPRGVFIILWLATISSFIFTLDTSSGEKAFPTFLIVLFLGNILIGIIAFILALSSKALFKGLKYPQIITYIPLAILAYFLFYVTSMTAGGHGLIASHIQINNPRSAELTSNEVIQAIPIASDTPTPTPTNIPSQQAKPVYIDPDPIIDCKSSAPNCNGSSIRVNKSQCSKITCCQIGSNWSVYPTSEKCTEAQKLPSNSQTVYPPCTVYYPLLHYSGTYYLSSTECNNLKNSANSVNSPQQINTPIPTQPVSTPAPNNSEYNDLLRRHQEACIQAASEWVGVREQWEQDNQNNYSSSAEMVMALRQRMALYQQELYSVGCTQTISL